ncbi:hypothetical protein [Agrobacterium vitis]|uniref:hypothetical protein n=1 Tax=Agrobacterium vitis TaxID=373 RepID=UPI0018D1FDB5|nr:hypothetical protein [Agrobacterium vitis]
MSKVQSKDAFLYDLNGDAGELKIALREAMELGSAADEAAGAFATARQGAKADSAIQPEDIVTTVTDGLMAVADKLKLNGIATGATANATDAALRDRSSHTGEQAMATITGLIAALAAKATPADISTAIASLVNSSPAAMDTLNELAAALGNDSNFATTMATALGNRVRYDAAESRTSEEKQQARNNIGAASNVAPLNATDYGVLPSLGSMTTAAVAFIMLANTLGRPAYFPAGDYNFATQPVVSSLRVGIHGDGQDTTRFVSGPGASGLRIDNTGLTSDQRTIEVSGIGFVTTGAGSGVGLTYLGSPIESTVLKRSISIERCRFGGITAASGWENGAILNKALCYSVTNCYFVGASAVFDSAPANQTDAALVFGNGSNLGTISNNIFDWVYTALTDADATDTEGFYFTNNAVRASINGVMIGANSGSHFYIADNHFDVVQRAVKLGTDGLIGQDYSTVRNNFILRASAASWGTAGAPNEFCAIEVIANSANITGNEILLTGKVVGDVENYKNSVGIRVGSVSDSNKQGRAVVANNILTGATTAVLLQAYARRCLVANNVAQDFGNPDAVGYVNNGGVTNLIENNTFVIESTGVVKEAIGADARRPYAEVYVTSNVLGVTGDGTAISFATLMTAVKNVGSALNVSTMVFTAPVPGVYSFNGTIGVSGATTSHLGTVRWIFSVGGDHNIFSYPYSGGANFAFEQYMAAGETVNAIFFASGGSKSVNLLGGKNNSRMSIRLVRPD